MLRRTDHSRRTPRAAKGANWDSSACRSKCGSQIRGRGSARFTRTPASRTGAGRPHFVSELAWVYVCLGRNAEALRLAREAAESMPIEKDAILGMNFLVGLAQIEAHTGQSEEAVKILRQLLTMPAGEYISVARLKIDPVWDPIRNNPEFSKTPFRTRAGNGL